jgi:hypothetical protein
MRKLLIYFFTADAESAESIFHFVFRFLCDLCASAVILFCSAFPQILRKIRQSDHYASQAHDIPRIDPAVKHSGNDSGKRQTHNDSDYED